MKHTAAAHAPENDLDLNFFVNQVYTGGCAAFPRNEEPTHRTGHGKNRRYGWHYPTHSVQRDVRLHLERSLKAL